MLPGKDEFQENLGFDISMDSLGTRKPTAMTMTTASRIHGTRSTKRIPSRKKAIKRKIVK